MKDYHSLRDYVRNYISEGIYEGRFELGDRISEQSVADQLGVSRTPAREALMQLHSEGILEYTPRKGFAIRHITDDERRDIYETTALLDAYAAVSALPHLTEADFAALNECVEKIDIAIKYRNTADYTTLQHEFHNLYRHRCQNGTVLRFLDTLESGLVPQVYVGGDEDDMFGLYSSVNEEHRTIVRLLEAGDTDEIFRYLMEVHWVPERE